MADDGRVARRRQDEQNPSHHACGGRVNVLVCGRGTYLSIHLYSYFDLGSLFNRSHSAREVISGAVNHLSVIVPVVLRAFSRFSA